MVLPLSGGFGERAGESLLEEIGLVADQGLVNAVLFLLLADAYDGHTRVKVTAIDVSPEPPSEGE